MDGSGGQRTFRQAPEYKNVSPIQCGNERSSYTTNFQHTNGLSHPSIHVFPPLCLLTSLRSSSINNPADKELKFLERYQIAWIFNTHASRLQVSAALNVLFKPEIKFFNKRYLMFISGMLRHPDAAAHSVSMSNRTVLVWGWALTPLNHHHYHFHQRHYWFCTVWQNKLWMVNRQTGRSAPRPDLARLLHMAELSLVSKTRENTLLSSLCRLLI